ncbi:hypothetical protein PSCLAVI8L_160108 [Pseudoclavibacter sp. 8L]|nr:hypothetical protein PSCLAVI8L_160108 [Pseudoclavibacter sp. 8L]
MAVFEFRFFCCPKSAGSAQGLQTELPPMAGEGERSHGSLKSCSGCAQGRRRRRERQVGRALHDPPALRDQG